MATLQVRLQDLATVVATECKSLRNLVSGGATNLTALSFGTKSNLVVALNELKTELDSVASASGATINDVSSASTTQTWSVTKISNELLATAAAVKNEILNGAGAAYDTLSELQALLEGDAATITSLNTAIGNRLRFDAAQALTAPQKAQACTNAGAAALVDTGALDTDFAAVFTTGLI